MKLNLNVIGLGFVGLTTLVGLAKKFRITGVELDNQKVQYLKKKKVPFFEKGLQENLIKNYKKIKFSKNVTLKRNELNVLFICIGITNKKNNKIDLNQVKKLINSIIINSNNKYKILMVIRSTIPPGSTDEIEKKFKKFKNIKFSVNPEFLREGSAWSDFINSDKIVIGSSDNYSKTIVSTIYKFLNCRIYVTNNKTAEFIKYLSNSLFSTIISFSNEMLMLADKTKNIDIKKAFNAVRDDKRWFGRPAGIQSYFNPGLGYGGFCLPKDTEVLDKFLKDKGIKNIVNSVVKINNKIINHQIGKIIKENNRNKKIYLLGLSFKAESDDIRNSRSIKVLDKLISHKFKNIICCDPVAIDNLKKFYNKKGLKFLKMPKINSRAIYLLCTTWPQYVQFLKKNKNLQKIDFRYVL